MFLWNFHRLIDDNIINENLFFVTNIFVERSNRNFE